MTTKIPNELLEATELASQITPSANAATITLTEDSSLFYCTAATNVTFTFAGAEAVGEVSSFVLELTNGGTFTIAWPGSVAWAEGTTPTLTAAGVDILVFYTRDGGTTWRGFLSSKDSKVPV